MWKYFDSQHSKTLTNVLFNFSLAFLFLQNFINVFLGIHYIRCNNFLRNRLSVNQIRAKVCRNLTLILSSLGNCSCPSDSIGPRSSTIFPFPSRSSITFFINAAPVDSLSAPTTEPTTERSVENILGQAVFFCWRRMKFRRTHILPIGEYRSAPFSS